MSAVYLDTHAAIWLHDGLLQKFTNSATKAMEANTLLLSPMVYLEFTYLYKRNKIRFPATTIFANLSTGFGITLCDIPFPAVAAAATEVEWTNDPFDRLIVAQATCRGNAGLVTADEMIRTNYAKAIW